MNWLKQLFYKIFYKKTGELVMGALTDVEACMIYKESIKNREKIIKNAVSNIIRDVDIEINKSTINGEFDVTRGFGSSKVTKSQQKYLIEVYENKGYKAKIKILFTDDFYNRKLVVSWKHWGKRGLK